MSGNYDIPVKCCRCRNKHMESDRYLRPKKNSGGISIRESVCPRCGSKNYYDMTPMQAWCWASGLIEFGEKAPADNADGSGCILFALGPKSFLVGAVTAIAREGMGASAGKLFVPGVPEAENRAAAIDALWAWLDFAAKKKSRHLSDGVVFVAREK